MAFWQGPLQLLYLEVDTMPTNRVTNHRLLGWATLYVSQ